MQCLAKDTDADRFSGIWDSTGFLPSCNVPRYVCCKIHVGHGLVPGTRVHVYGTRVPDEYSANRCQVQQMVLYTCTEWYTHVLGRSGPKGFEVHAWNDGTLQQPQILTGTARTCIGSTICSSPRGLPHNSNHKNSLFKSFSDQVLPPS